MIYLHKREKKKQPSQLLPRIECFCTTRHRGAPHIVEVFEGHEEELENEGVPHEEEGHCCPIDVAAVVQDNASDQVSPYVTAWKKAVEAKEESNLETLPEEVDHSELSENCIL